MKKVAIQGIKGSFHDQVATKIFGSEYEAVCCEKFQDIFNYLEEDQCDFGVLAIENTTAGTILENYKILRDSYVQIIGEAYCKIDLQLMALPGQERNEIDTVISHEMALKQCTHFLDEKQIFNRRSYRDTSSAAKHIGTNRIKGVYAIASEEAAKLYGLEIMSRNIQNNTKNYTRFLIIKKPSHSGLSTDKNKATIVFSVINEPGRLARVLSFLDKKKINLTKIESVPHFNNLGNFDMITDLEITDESDFKTVLPELNQLVDEIKILGIYNKEREPWVN